MLGLWSTHGVLSGDVAPERLDHLVALLVDGTGAVVGTSSVYEAAVPLIGGRTFQIYRRFLVPDVPDDAELAMVAAAYTALDERFDPDAGTAVGLFTLVDEAAFLARHPEAVWPGSELVYAGYLSGGRQARLRYFHGARIGEGPPPGARNLDPTELVPDAVIAGGYLIRALGEPGGATADDVLAFWARHGAVGAEEARRRVHEVVSVATTTTGELVGVFTAGLTRSEQLGMDLWFTRAFIDPSHRVHEITRQLVWHARTLLEHRFLSGEDTRSAGHLEEMENAALRRRYPEAVMPTWGSVFIGETARGSHVRVRYFPGVHAPPPPAG